MRLSPVKAIKQHCLECSGGSKKEVRLCVITDCPLHPYRLGKNPNRAGIKKASQVKKIELADSKVK